jgi:hypothetical protein
MIFLANLAVLRQRIRIEEKAPRDATDRMQHSSIMNTLVYAEFERGARCGTSCWGGRAFGFPSYAWGR